MNKFESKNVFIANLLIILSISVLVFFTRGLYTDLQVSKNQKENAEIELKEKTQELAKLSEIKKNISETDKQELSRYDAEYSDADVLYFIQDLANNFVSGVTVDSIKVEEGVTNKIGFKEGNAVLAISYDSEENLLDFISKLTTSNDFVVYVDTLNYPMTFNTGETTSSINKVNLPLTIYYK